MVRAFMLLTGRKGCIGHWVLFRRVVKKAMAGSEQRHSAESDLVPEPEGHIEVFRLAESVEKEALEISGIASRMTHCQA